MIREPWFVAVYECQIPVSRSFRPARRGCTDTMQAHPGSRCGTGVALGHGRSARRASVTTLLVRLVETGPLQDVGAVRRAPALHVGGLAAVPHEADVPGGPFGHLEGLVAGPGAGGDVGQVRGVGARGDEKASWRWRSRSAVRSRAPCRCGAFQGPQRRPVRAHRGSESESGKGMRNCSGISVPGWSEGASHPGRVSSDVLRRLGGGVEEVFQRASAEEAGPDRGEHGRPEDEHDQRHP